MKCTDRLSIWCRKKSMNELLRLIHDEYTAAYEGNTEYGKLIPYQWSNSIKVSNCAHGSNVCTNAIKCRLFHSFSCVGFRCLQFHIPAECKVNDRCKSL